MAMVSSSSSTMMSKYVSNGSLPLISATWATVFPSSFLSFGQCIRNMRSNAPCLRSPEGPNAGSRSSTISRLILALFPGSAACAMSSFLPISCRYCGSAPLSLGARSVCMSLSIVTSSHRSRASSTSPRVSLVLPQAPYLGQLWDISTLAPLLSPIRMASLIASAIVSRSPRMCDVYMPPYFATTLQSSMISSVLPKQLGGYTRPVDMPNAPADIASSTSAFICLSCPGDGSSLPEPITAVLTAP